MNFEELKADWQNLNQRLENVEIVNKELTRELIRSKVSTHFHRIYRYDYFFVWFILGVMIMFCPLFATAIFTWQTMVLFEVILLLCSIWQIFQVCLLNRIKHKEDTTFTLLKEMTRYQLLTKGRFIGGLLMVIPIFVLGYFFERDHMENYMMISAGVGGVIGGLIGSLMELKHLRNIKVYLNTLRDLRVAYGEQE